MPCVSTFDEQQQQQHSSKPVFNRTAAGEDDPVETITPPIAIESVSMNVDSVAESSPENIEKYPEDIKNGMSRSDFFSKIPHIFHRIVMEM